MKDKKLIETRNAKIVERFTYWTEVKRRRVDDTMKILSEEEFFLSENTILKIIKERGVRREE